MASVYKVVINVPYNLLTSSVEVGCVIGREKAEQLKELTTQKIKAIEGWQKTYRELLNGEPAVYVLLVCDLLEF